MNSLIDHKIVSTYQLEIQLVKITFSVSIPQLYPRMKSNFVFAALITTLTTSDEAISTTDLMKCAFTKCVAPDVSCFTSSKGDHKSIGNCALASNSCYWGCAGITSGEKSPDKYYDLPCAKDCGNFDITCFYGCNDKLCLKQCAISSNTCWWGCAGVNSDTGTAPVGKYDLLCAKKCGDENIDCAFDCDSHMCLGKCAFIAGSCFLGCSKETLLEVDSLRGGVNSVLANN